MAKRKIAGSVDTNILLRYLLNDVPDQSKKIDKVLGDGVVLSVSDVVVSEAVFVLEKVYDLGRDVIVQNLHLIATHPQFVCNRPLWSEVVKLYENEASLSVVDCMALVYARLNKHTPLYSFDKQLIKKAEGDCVAPK